MIPINYPQHRRIESIRRALTLGLGAQLIALPALLAQNSAEPEERTMTITGTLIPTTTEAAEIAPIETFYAERVSQSGVQDVRSVLKVLTPYFAGNGNTGQEVNNGGAGEANIALRNLDTLVLLDGRRLASSALSQGTAIDLNTIPIGMIERIEVLKDGASTLYGADAIGGVVNIITRKSFNGYEISGRYGFNTGKGDVAEYRGSIVAGSSTEKTSVILGLSYYNAEGLRTADRYVASAGIAELAKEGIVPPSYVSGNYNARVDDYVLAGSEFAKGHPGYNAAVTTPPVIPGRTFSSLEDYNEAAFTKFGYRPYVKVEETVLGQASGSTRLLNTAKLGTYAIQPQNRYSAAANFSHQIFGKHLEAFGDFMYTKTRSESQLAPAPVAFLGQYNITVPKENPYNPFGIDLGSNGEASPNIRTRFIDFGNRIWVPDTDYFRFVGGLKGEINDRYGWETAYTFNRSSQEQIVKNAVNGAALNDALTPDLAADPTGKTSVFLDPSGNPVPTYNIFATPGQNDPATIRALTTTAFQNGQSDLWTWDATVHGRPFDLPAGALGFALGGQYINESLDIAFDGLYANNLLPGLNAGTSFENAGRERWAGFAELSIPVFSKDFNIPGFSLLEFSASGRIERLEPGGTAEKPKIGFRWQPIDEQITLRGSFSQGFIAPSMFSLFGPTQPNVPNLSINGVSEQQQTLEVSNPDLPPAESVNYTGGIILAPKCLKGFAVTADYYNINVDGFPYRPSARDMVEDINRLGSGSPYASLFRRKDNTGITTTDPNQINHANFGLLTVPLLPGQSQRTSGVDLGTQYTFDTTTAGRFTFRVEATILLGYEANLEPGGEFYQYAGYYTDDGNEFPSAQGALPDYMLVPSMTWEYQNFTLNVISRYVPSISDPYGLHPAIGDTAQGFTLDDKLWKVSDYYSIDLQLSYDFKSSKGGRWYDDTRLTVGCNNVTDNIAPLIASAFEDNTDKSTYDILGRFVYFEVSKKF